MIHVGFSEDSSGTTKLSIGYVYICHCRQLTKVLLEKYPFVYIVFVGEGDIDDEILNNDKVFIARNYLDNIEEYKYLLTFTAWYLIIKNKLLTEFSHLCLLESDMVLNDDFKETMDNSLLSNPDLQVISFSNINWGFMFDITRTGINSFLDLKDISLDDTDVQNDWWPTTNHILSINIISDFIDWYYPDCLKIKDTRKAWYFERLLSVYFKTEGIKPITVTKKNNHKMENSHIIFTNPNNNMSKPPPPTQRRPHPTQQQPPPSSRPIERRQPPSPRPIQRRQPPPSSPPIQRRPHPIQRRQPPPSPEPIQRQPPPSPEPTQRQPPEPRYVHPPQPVKDNNVSNLTPTSINRSYKKPLPPFGTKAGRK